MLNGQKKKAMQNNKIYIQERIPKDSYDPDGSMDLDNTYGQAVSELGLQQSKRDQIIAFYLTILGLVAPSVIGMDVSDLAKATAFFAMYCIGVVFCHVILRYRIYKEVYWIACRVITQLCNIKKQDINKNIVYTLFYNCLKKNEGTIVVKHKPQKPSVLLSFIHQLNSAETLLYETLVFFSSFVGLIGSWLLSKVSVVFAVISVVCIVCMIIAMNIKYTKRLVDLYTCVDTREVCDLEKTFSKAWMLHCYVDDIVQ